MSTIIFVSFFVVVIFVIIVTNIYYKKKGAKLEYNHEMESVSIKAARANDGADDPCYKDNPYYS